MTLEEQFEAMTAETVHDFVKEGQQEHTQLEFKVLNAPDFKHKDDKKNFAKEASAFANGAGGIIVWGVEAGKDDDGVDRATASKPISRLQLALSRLRSLESEALLPRHGAMRHKALLIGEDEGFLITLVPESEAGPHMAKLGVNQYFKRSGDSARLMEHFDLADMFGRRPKPRLHLSGRLAGVAQGQNKGQVYVVVSVINEGRGTAKGPHLVIETPGAIHADDYGVDGNRNVGLPRLFTSRPGQETAFGGDASVLIHPGVSRDVTRLRIPAPLEQDLAIQYSISAEDMPAQRGELTITAEEVRKHLW